MGIITQIARSRRRRGITAAQVAERTGLKTSNLYAIEQGRRSPTVETLERAAAGLGLRLLAVDIGELSFVSDFAEVIADYDADGAEEQAYRAFMRLNRQLAAAPATTQVLLTYTPPRPVTVEWDAALAGLVEWRLRQKDAPIPDWVEENLGLDAGHWEPWPSVRHTDPDVHLVPGPFRRRGIWIEAGELDAA
ncbi:transcriptional regulator with XRE-family HTH domain [Microbacterium ginsengiterrae]|uniref:Transcriptional regulator with XRE-family HTH domain n=1 Tax=Microbacterium ginsengiterrae TaxID=546115 RepID=A0A7W9FCE1_9MICO|nr:transcriptional regulator with XRE-family HTH domain [Microbacterium ginsengiterrae]